MMSLSKSQKDKAINDFLFGIEDLEYEVKQKNDGGCLVKRTKKKSPFTNIKQVPKVEKQFE
jgi:hypothetical protein